MDTLPRIVPHFILLNEEGSDRRIIVNTSLIHTITPAENLGSFVHLIGGVSYMVTQYPAAIIAKIYHPQHEEK